METTPNLLETTKYIGGVPFDLNTLDFSQQSEVEVPLTGKSGSQLKLTADRTGNIAIDTGRTDIKQFLGAMLRESPYGRAVWFLLYPEDEHGIKHPDLYAGEFASAVLDYYERDAPITAIEFHWAKPA